MAQAMLRTAAFLAYGNSNFTQAGLEKAQRAPWWPATEAALQGAPLPLAGKTVAVTGANAGVGLAIASRVAELGATTLLLCRSAERGRAAAEAIRAAAAEKQKAAAATAAGAMAAAAAAEAAAAPAPAAPAAAPAARVEVEEVDVSCLASVARLAARLEQQQRPIHCLVDNAGVLAPGGWRAAEPEGWWEASFATNVAGTAALTLALKPALLRARVMMTTTTTNAAATAAAATTNHDDADNNNAYVPRVVIVSSGGMLTSPLLIAAPLDPPPPPPLGAGPPFDGTKAYSRDKRRQVALAEALARRWRADGLCVASYHPGWADTPGVQTSLPAFRRAFEGKLRTPQGGADTAVWMACAPVDLREEEEEAAAAPPSSSSPSSAQSAAFLRPGEFYLDRRPQAKHLLGASGRLAGTAYTREDADALLARVEELLRDKGFAFSD